MWANFARDTHFTAGNTILNRIESNWNQLKMLLEGNYAANCVGAG
ncbi:hypothetical protein F443_22907 [Phytophthora nicotianae P1569]|uniref:Uncharacterized protein n=1 Tax=Phytophthora nicotianae P1569 TaxID=1317065 RepID=V9DSY4_PHYNI|nr:hypothetical protein F443_22907 [Phytophthora nicotianae P1569]